MKPSRRKQWIINKPFQYKFIAISILPVLATVLTFWVSIEIIFYLMITKGQEMNLPSGHVYYELLTLQKDKFLIASLISGALVSGIFGFWSLFMSNKIAGPLYRLTNHLKSLNQENIKTFQPLKFRDKDYFMEIAEEVNKFIKRL